MRQTRLYLDGEYGSGSALEIDAERTHYLSRVLRLRVGDTIVIFNGTGAQFSASITALQRTRATLAVHDAIAAETESGFKLHLAQGISRGERMDFVVQKATELGVKRITPLLTEHGVVKLAAERADKRRQHWRQVATSACEQSGRVRLPLIDAPVRLDTWLTDKTQHADIDILLKPGASAALATIDVPATKVCILIGPEGGFSDTEYALAELTGFRAVALGPRVLRTETAAVAALAVLQARCGDLS
jgi:16S rRNA (uracil1498-N3)-methyltransferase